MFSINRYGDEKEGANSGNDNLSELLKRIEERKQERALKINNEVDKGIFQCNEKSTHKRKKRKEKINECSTQNINVEEKIESVNDRKKKRKKENANIEETYIKNETNRGEIESTESENTNEKTNQLSCTNTIEKRKIVQETNFVVLGSKTGRKKHEVKRILPEWLANPEIISLDLNSGPSLEELDTVLDIKLVDVLSANGINKLFPVQTSLISWLLKCDKSRKEGMWLRDTCVSAPTGSGKTLAYVLPIIQILQSRLVTKIRCLIVVPTQELATQVYKVTVTYAVHTSLRIGLLSGASALCQEQCNILKQDGRGQFVSLVDIVVATPGRLIDHILKTPGFSLDSLRFLVIDEADKAADWLEYLPEPHYRAPQLTLENMRRSKVPAQKLLFSATLSQDPEKLNRLGLFHPILFTSVLVTGKDDDVNLDKEVGDFISRYTVPEELMEQAVECIAEYKPVAVYQLLNRNNVTPKTLVFTNSGEAAHRLTILLQMLLSKENIVVGELSAKLMPKEREDVLKNFATGKSQILVSSDALARGVDVPDVQLVISYDLPKHIKGYIHRAGRTGRAGKLGTAISVLTSQQVKLFNHMLSSVHKAIPRIEKLELNSIADEIGYSNLIEQLRHVLETERKGNLSRTRTVKRIHSVITEKKI